MCVGAAGRGRDHMPADVGQSSLFYKSYSGSRGTYYTRGRGRALHDVCINVIPTDQGGMENTQTDHARVA